MFAISCFLRWARWLSVGRFVLPLAASLAVCLNATAAPAAETRMVLHDNIKLVTQRKLVYPQILLAYVRWHEDLCKGLGLPVVSFQESDLNKLFGEETTTYLSGGNRMTHRRSWSLGWLSRAPGGDQQKCDFSLVNGDRVEVMTDARNVLFQLNNKLGKTEVLDKSAPTVLRTQQERAQRLAQLADPNSLWARRLFAERVEAKVVNSIPCAMTTNRLSCLFEKMPYHVPSGKALAIQSELIPLAIKSLCEDTPLDVLKKSYRDLGVCALQSIQEATEIEVDVAMPPGAFGIPEVAKAFPIKYIH